jgi:hypothetical protein
MLGTLNIYVAFTLRFPSCYVLQILMDRKSNFQVRLDSIFPRPNLPWGLVGGNPLCATFFSEVFSLNK